MNRRERRALEKQRRLAAKDQSQLRLRTGYSLTDAGEWVAHCDLYGPDETASYADPGTESPPAEHRYYYGPFDSEAEAEKFCRGELRELVQEIAKTNKTMGLKIAGAYYHQPKGVKMH